jgi:AcrR family transcriptional regulator
VTTVTTPRRPNKRGQGERLRGEIVAGAAALLEEHGNEDAVTLRAVARRVGISAPSIYGHFADRDAVLLAVIAEAFGELAETLAGAAAAAPGDELRAVCRAYVRFGRERPGRYRVMFGRHRAAEGGAVNQLRSAGDLLGADAFSHLVRAVAQDHDDGHPQVHDDTRGDPAPDPAADAVAVWVALHGYVSLRDAVPAFPWPPEAALVETMVTRLTGRSAHPGASSSGITRG